MFSFIITLIIIVSLLLMLVVLAQNSKGSGVSSQFGGSTTSQVIGVKKTGTFLEKMTWGLAITLLGLSLLSNSMIERGEANVLKNPVIEKAQESTILPSIQSDQNTGLETEEETNEQSEEQK